MTKALMKSCLFIVCKTMFTIGESQAFLMQTEQQTQERRIVNPRRGRFDTEKSSGAKNADLKFNGASSRDGWRRQQQTAEQRTSLNEFQMLKFFKSKWKRFWIISLINIWANIAVTKHVLLADEFVPYRPRLLGFHSLHVNAMKCIYVGFSLSKLQSFFWKISLNSCLIRLEGFNNKTSTQLVARGLVVKLSPGAPKGPSSNLGMQDLFFFASFLFFSFLVFFFFFFSFSFHFRYNSFVMFLYIAYIF